VTTGDGLEVEYWSTVKDYSVGLCLPRLRTSRGRGHRRARVAGRAEVDGDAETFESVLHTRAHTGGDHHVDMMIAQETHDPRVMSAFATLIMQHAPRNLDLLPIADRA